MITPFLSGQVHGVQLITWWVLIGVLLAIDVFLFTPAGRRLLAPSASRHARDTVRWDIDLDDDLDAPED